MEDKKVLSFWEISEIDDDLERNEALYELLEEEKRLQSRAGQIEYLTTMHYIEEILPSQANILDVGAATGVYSIPLALQGHRVTAIEPSRENIRVFHEKLKSLTDDKANNELAQNLDIDLRHASSFDMQELPDNQYDLVLLFGPLYHLSKREDQEQTLRDAKRVLKPGGHILVAFINHDMIPLTETVYDVDWFAGDTYDHETLRISDRPFIFFRYDECVALLESNGLKIEKAIASDGFSEILAKQIKDMSEKAYEMYVKWHMSRCEKEELLGATNHFLFVCRIQTGNL